MEGQPPPTYVQPGAAVPSVVGAVVPEGGGKAQGGAVASAPPAYAPVVQATVLQAGYGGDQFGLNPAAVPQQPQVAQVVQAESWQNAVSVSPARPPAAGVCAKESFKICVAAVVGAVLCGLVVFLAMGGGDDLVDGGPTEPICPAPSIGHGYLVIDEDASRSGVERDAFYAGTAARVQCDAGYRRPLDSPSLILCWRSGLKS